jgi:hypothetical protein
VPNIGGPFRLGIAEIPWITVGVSDPSLVVSLDADIRRRVQTIGQKCQSVVDRDLDVLVIDAEKNFHFAAISSTLLSCRWNCAEHRH